MKIRITSQVQGRGGEHLDGDVEIDDATAAQLIAIGKAVPLEPESQPEPEPESQPQPQPEPESQPQPQPKKK